MDFVLKVSDGVFGEIWKSWIAYQIACKDYSIKEPQYKNFNDFTIETLRMGNSVMSECILEEIRFNKNN